MKHALLVLALGTLFAPSSSGAALTVPDLDEMLGGRRAMYKGRALMGSTGARLFCDQLEVAPGFRGEFEWMNGLWQGVDDPVRLSFEMGGERKEAGGFTWRWSPSVFRQEGRVGPLEIVEEKFIAWDDVLVDVVTLRNASDAAIEFTAMAELGKLGAWREGETVRGRGTSHGKPVFACLGFAPGTTAAPGGPADSTLRRTVRIGPRSTARLVLSAGFGLTEAEAVAGCRRWQRARDPVAEHRAEYRRWFDANCPRFSCSDPRFEKLWWYRWFLVRHNLADLRAGNLLEPAFYEGRHKEWYPQVIVFSVPLHLTEARWLRDPRWVRGEISNLLKNQGSDGQIRGISVADHQGWYTHWIPKAAMDAALVLGDRKLEASLVEPMARELDWEAASFDRDQDGLLLSPNHFATGMEWRPSFFHFSRGDPYREEALETPDYAAYHHAGLVAVSEAARRSGRNDLAERFADRAERTRAAMLRVLWDPERSFFFGAREGTGERTASVEATGLFPFFSGAAGEPHADAWRRLFDPEELWTAHPPASCSKRDPLYDQRDFPRKHDKIEPHQFDCRWNGPTWPYDASLLLDALGRFLQARTGAAPGASSPLPGLARRDETERAAHVPPRPAVVRAGRSVAGAGRDASPETFHELLTRYASLHFDRGGGGGLNLCEYYDGETGEAIGVPDYFHSYANDLLIRFVGGLVPSGDETIRLRPIPVTWRAFRFDRLRYRGRELSIVWDRDRGFSLVVAGREVARRKDLGPLDWTPGRRAGS